MSSTTIPEHLLPAIRRAAAWEIDHQGEALGAPIDADDWPGFAERIAALEVSIATLRTLGMPGSDPKHIDAKAIAPIVREAASTAYYDLATLTEQYESARNVVEQAQIVADLDAFADQLDDQKGD